jgi:hypothetical protein
MLRRRFGGYRCSARAETCVSLLLSFRDELVHRVARFTQDVRRFQDSYWVVRGSETEPLGRTLPHERVDGDVLPGGSAPGSCTTECKARCGGATRSGTTAWLIRETGLDLERSTASRRNAGGASQKGPPRGRSAEPSGHRERANRPPTGNSVSARCGLHEPRRRRAPATRTSTHPPKPPLIGLPTQPNSSRCSASSAQRKTSRRRDAPRATRPGTTAQVSAPSGAPRAADHATKLRDLLNRLLQ